MKFGIPLERVELFLITDYRLMLFTVLNTANLESGMGEFKYQMDEEEIEQMEREIEFFKRKGVQF